MVLFWPRDDIDLGDSKSGQYRGKTTALKRGRLWYPTRITSRSLPAVHQGILEVEDIYAKQADGAIEAMDRFALIAGLGSGGPILRSVPRRATLQASRLAPAGTTARGGATTTSRAELLAANRAAGRAAESLTVSQLLAEGNTILGSQVSVRTSLGLRRIDHLIQTPSGQLVAIEVKAGGAVRNVAQLAKDAALATEGGVIIGKNAPAALRGQHLIIQTVERIIQ